MFQLKKSGETNKKTAQKSGKPPNFGSERVQV
jgi:hypothetical protein